jgi:hydrogenase expression/formation protein HypE
MAERGAIVRTGGARPGDALVQAGPAPIEGAALLAREARERLGSLPLATLARAQAALEEPGISVVEPALLCAKLGASSLHDPTEGGLAAGLAEIAEASGLRLLVREERVLWFEPGRSVCQALGADPWATLASGALLATFPAERARAACEALEKSGVPARVIGAAEAGSGVWLSGGRPLPLPERDEVARILS